MAVASAGPYTNNLHLAPDRQLHQNLIAHHKCINLGGIKFSDEWATKLLEVVSGSLETGSVVMDGCTRSHNCSPGYNNNNNNNNNDRLTAFDPGQPG